MHFRPLLYSDGPRGHEIEKECQHTRISDCGHYRITRDRLDGTGNYTAWVRAESPPPGTLYSSSTGKWHAIHIARHSQGHGYPDAQAAASHHDADR